MAIADNSKLQTPQPLFGGYAPCTVPGIGIRAPGLVDRLRAGGDGIDLDFRRIIEERSIGGQWEIEFMGRSIRPYDEGDVMAFGFSAGGAGYGDPLEADPDAVAHDFVDGLISEWTMREVYWVAYDAEEGVVLTDETEALRAREREARAARDSDWATFEAEWSALSPPEDLLMWFGSWPEGVATAPVMRM
jgi:N-methylhydantoinase B/oxoprolinase/acetone carboxylase alpha subunit